MTMADKKYLKRTVKKDSLYSQHLGEERSLRIYFPPGYDELQSYSILYAQDGQDVFMFGRIATIANYLTLERDMEPVIVVGVDVQKQFRTSEYAPVGERNEDYRHFFTDELVPYIEEQIPVRNTGLQRLLVGDSLGGTVSLDIALDHPEMFQHIISLSGAYLQRSIHRLEAEDDLNWLDMWMLIGTDETNVETHLGELDFLSWNRKAKQELEEKGASITYYERKGKHLWGFWQEHLPEALLHFCG
jgi:enterochelin esterase-like enzyme